MTFFAKRGERATCTQGHVIFTVARDLSMGDPIAPELDFADWQQPRPALGTPTNQIVCTVCGAPWVRSAVMGGADGEDGKKIVTLTRSGLCIEGQWR